jgi:hypothetical protein
MERLAALFPAVDTVRKVTCVFIVAVILLGIDTSWRGEETQAGQTTMHKASPGHGKHGRPTAADSNLTINHLRRGVLLGDLCLEDSMLSDAGLTIPAGCYDLLLSVITDIAPQDNLPASQARYNL